MTSGRTQASALATLEQEVLALVTPPAGERGALMQDCSRLEQAAEAALVAEGLRGKARVQGSVAKGTWLRDGADLDLFLLLDPSVPAAELETVASRVGHRVLEDCRKKYAQHPYVMGRFGARRVDLVPAYEVPSASSKMSAVDRTPFHTAWVRAQLTGPLRGQVRLAKLWLKGTGTYGAQTAIGGFSGYLVEVLIVHTGGFHGFLAWLASDASPRRIAPGPDEVRDDVSPLVVVDPVDPARNGAAAVTHATLERAVEAARAYRASPDRRFFFPAPARGEAPDTLERALATQGATWAGVVLTPKTDRLDIVFPQFQRALRTLASDLARAGFPVVRSDVAASADETSILLQFIAHGPGLPPTRRHRGPKDDGRPHAQRFREKWQGHPDALGPVAAVEGHLEVEVHVRDRTPADWLRSHLGTAALGRHVQDALAGAPVMDSPGQAPVMWASRVADVVLDRRPWTR